MSEELTSAALSELSRQAGYTSMTERLLEDMRARELLPAVRRRANVGRKPVWVHPPGTASQLFALLKLRESTRNADLLRVALWYQGYPVPLVAVRRSIVVRMQLLVDELALTLERPHNEIDGDRIREVASILAGRRGKRSVGPRTSRMAREERVDGVAYLLALIVGAPAESVGDPVLAERVLGINWGRHGLGAENRWIASAPGEEAAALRDVLSLHSWVEAVKGASDAELLAARDTAARFMTGLPVVALFLEASLGPSAAGLAGLRDFAAPSPESVPPLLAFVVHLLRTHADGVAELGAALEPAIEARSGFELLASLEPADREKRLDSLPAEDAIRLRRMIKTYTAQTRET